MRTVVPSQSGPGGEVDEDSCTISLDQVVRLMRTVVPSQSGPGGEVDEDSCTITVRTRW